MGGWFVAVKLEKRKICLGGEYGRRVILKLDNRYHMPGC